MANIKRTTRNILASVFFLSLIMNFIACSEQSPLSSEQQENIGAETLAKWRTKPEANYPFTGSYVFKYWPSRDIYRGGVISTPDLSAFVVEHGALIPPPEMTYGEDVTITMTAEYDSVNNSLFFTFGPHGAKFQPSATVYLKYEVLGIEVPTLYYIDENDNYVEQTPDRIDIANRGILIKIDHFSRYFLGSTL